MNTPTDFRSLPAGTVVFARLDDNPPLLGTVAHVPARDGGRLPTFNLWATPSHLPLVELRDEPDSGTRFSAADYTLDEFLAPEQRQALATFYAAACKRFGWVRDEHATLNVIYRLEQAGIREIDHDNLGLAINLAYEATQAVYAYVRQFAKLKLAA